MNNAYIIYEQPLNELVRTCLRLEHLFNQINSCLASNDVNQQTHVLVKLIIDILEILNRPDLKSKLTKEFSRFILSFSRLLLSPEIDQARLSITLQQLKNLMNHFLSTHGKIAQGLRDNEFITNIRQNLLTVGGGCHIDTPHYYYWLNQPADIHAEQIQNWISEFTEIREAIDLLLEIVRNSSEPRSLIAKDGFHHEPLDSKLSCQLIRVSIESQLKLYPEISVGRHYLSIHFMAPSIETRPRQTKKDTSFKLTKCII